MRAIVIVVLGLLHATSAAAGIEHARLTPPAGWTEGPLPPEQLAEARKGPGVLRVDATSWLAPDGDVELIVLELVQRRIGNVRAQIRSIENGARTATKPGTQLALHEADDGWQVVVDHSVQLEDRHLRTRRRYAVGKDGIYLAVANCGSVTPAAAAAAACEPALASLQLTVPGAEELPSTDPAYRIGYAVGQALPFVVGVVLVIYFVRRSRRRERERVATLRRERERIASEPPPQA